MCKTIKFYNNNAVEVIATKGEYSIVKLNSDLSEKQLREIALQNCEGCQSGESTHCHCELNESIAVDLFDVIAAQTACFFVHNNMLMDKPVEFAKYAETLRLTKEESEKCNALKAERNTLLTELEQLKADIETKKQELAQLQESMEVKQDPVVEVNIQREEKDLSGLETVTITKDEYAELLLRDKKLTILEIDGVDNWEWYLEGQSDFIAKSVQELVKPFNEQQVKQLLAKIGVNDISDDLELSDLVKLELLIKG